MQVTALTDHEGRPFVIYDPVSNTYLDAIQVELLGIMTSNLPPECLTLVKPTISDEMRVIQLQIVVDEAFSSLSEADDWDALDKALTLLSRYCDATNSDADWVTNEVVCFIGDQDNPLGT